MKHARQQPAGPILVFDGRYIQDRYHGIGRYAFHLIRELTQLMPAQAVHIVRDATAVQSRFDWTALAGPAGVTMAEIRAPVFRAREQVAMPRLLRQHQPTIYHSPYFALPWLVTGLALVTVHDCIFEHNSADMPLSWFYRYYRLLMRRSLRRARYVFVPSHATAADVTRFYGVPEAKLVVTGEAADATFAPLDDHQQLSAVRRRYGLPERFVLAVGTRRPHKNLALLVQAVAHIEDASLVLVGEADQRFPDEAAQAAQGLAGKVRFLGKVPEQDLPALYNLATVLACPSRIEGFGLPVLEAMACGTPVVCSDVPVFREVALGAALLAPPSDPGAWASQLSSCLTDADLRASLRRAGLERAALFSWRRAAVAVLRVYRQLGLATPSEI